MAALIPGLQARQSSTSLLNQLFSRRLCKGANYFSRCEILSGADSNMILSAPWERSRQRHFNSNHSHLSLLPISQLLPLAAASVPFSVGLGQQILGFVLKQQLLAALWIGNAVPLVLEGCSKLGWQVWDGLSDCQMGWFGIMNHPGSSQCETGITGTLNSSSCHIASFSPQILPALQQAALKRTRIREVSLVSCQEISCYQQPLHHLSPKGLTG